ncbi:MAG: nitroreductase family protein [Paludibacter sp.]|nr:nitroreductase family protein [Paludibacter sp.]
MGSQKEKLKSMLPQRVLYYFYLLKSFKSVSYDLKRRVRDKVYDNSEPERVKRNLTLAYHIVEKGLTMPEPRPGFGKKVVLGLIDSIFKYERMNLPKDVIEFKQAVSVLREYRDFHKNLKFTLDEDVSEKLDAMLVKFDNVHGEKQFRISAEEYFKDIKSPFDKFCRSRYSVRNYSSKEIPLSVLYDCIDLAQKSPSFCNRQPTRVHIVKSKEQKEKILNLQNGNRGFGYLADTLLVITSLISTTKDIYERNENHLNGGMFSMTLLNALHFNEIGACALNWSVEADKDMSLRKILGVPENEVILLIISCGYLPEIVSLAASPRKTAREISYEHL